jgi:sugar phosphate isomerase/epimerase
MALNGKKYLPALIGDGVVNHRSVLKAMQEAGYEGYINLEYESSEIPVVEAMKKACSYLRKINPAL